MNILITGTSRGLGHQLINIIASKHPNANVFATIRNNAEEAQEKWKAKYPQFNIRCLTLDLKDQKSIGDFKHKIEEGTKFDFIINNAAVCFFQPLKFADAQQTIETNLKGTITLTNAMLPHLKENGRIVMVSSKLGALNDHPQKGRKIYSNKLITEEQILKGAQRYLIEFKGYLAMGQTQVKQLNEFAIYHYSVSKMLLNCWSRFVLLPRLSEHQTVICMSPGRCQTDMGGKDAFFTLRQGSESIYDCMWIKGGRDPNLFYHRGKETDYEGCGAQFIHP